MVVSDDAAGQIVQLLLSLWSGSLGAEVGKEFSYQGTSGPK